MKPADCLNSEHVPHWRLDNVLQHNAVQLGATQQSGYL